MDFDLLRHAERLGGTLLQAPGTPPLLVVERLARHGAPQLLVLAGEAALLDDPVRAIEALHLQGLDLNLIAAFDPGAGREASLLAHRTRLGALLCALEVRPAEPRPILPKRLPGWIQAERPQPLATARLAPLERAQLQEHFPDWPPERIQRVFAGPDWVPQVDGWRTRWWPGVELPADARVVSPGLELPTASPAAEALRGALRSAIRMPVPCLPLDLDPSRLHALALLCPDVQLFQGPPDAWLRVLPALAALPAPPHFCARC